jgi:transposase
MQIHYAVPKTDQNLDIAESMSYAWRAKSRQTGQPFENQKLQPAEIARLKRENAQLKDEVTFLRKAAVCIAKQPKYQDQMKATFL